MNKILGFVLFTIVEIVALIGWLVLALPEGGQVALGVAVLLVGMIIEHFIAFKATMEGDLPTLGLIGISISETVLWVVWLLIVQSTGSAHVWAVIFLFVTMFLQHGVEKNIFIGKPAFQDLLKTEVIVFTAVEVGAAGLWLYFILEGQEILGAAILVVGIFVEHILQSRQSLPE